jgi:hypothetical protein
MAIEFQHMLKEFSIEDKILSLNADNATSNDTQTAKLTSLPNSFEEENRVRCFNHTMQLFAKELIKPFNAGMSARQAGDDGDMPIGSGNDCKDDDNDKDEDKDGNSNDNSDDDKDNKINKIEEMTEEEREEIVADTAIVRETVTKAGLFTFFYNTSTNNMLKIRQLSFAIIHSTTFMLPAWCTVCADVELKAHLIPCDVVTRWNSTYDMLAFALKYRPAIDTITADKALKLRKYELDHLDDKDWNIVRDLVCVFEVSELEHCVACIAQPTDISSAIQKGYALFLE